jgi:colanic acid/amylovoran biosynthesis glycosyltransferase
MRIAFVVWRFPVLSEPFILNQIAGLIDRGHDVQIFALNGAPDDAGKVHDLVERYDLMARAHLVDPLPERGQLAAVMNRIAGPALRNPVKAARVLARARHAATPLKMLNRAAVLLDAGRFDIVHCQFGSLALPILEFRKAGLMPGRLVTHFRGIDISSFVKENGADVYDEVFGESDYFLANCGFFRDKAIALGCPKARIEAHGSGIDLSMFPFRALPPVGNGPVRLISAGRLVEKKGLITAIRAVANVLRSGKDVQYEIIGDGPERARLEALAIELGVADHVTFHGWRTHTEISELLAGAHVFLAPCQTAADGNQDAPVNTLKEAMAIGLPVIASRHGGIPELVEDGVSGFLVPERDADALTKAIARMIAMPETWDSIAKAGRAAVERLYDMERLNDELVALYQALTTPRGAETKAPNQTFNSEIAKCG